MASVYGRSKLVEFLGVWGDDQLAMSASWSETLLQSTRQRSPQSTAPGPNEAEEEASQRHKAPTQAAVSACSSHKRRPRLSRQRNIWCTQLSGWLQARKQRKQQAHFFPGSQNRSRS